MGQKKTDPTALASDIFPLKMEDYLCNKARPLGKAGRGRKRWVPPRWQACGWILDTLNALAYLHQGGVKQWVHRDLKPANLLLSFDHVVSALKIWTLRVYFLAYMRCSGFDRVCRLIVHLKGLIHTRGSECGIKVRIQSLQIC